MSFNDLEIITKMKHLKSSKVFRTCETFQKKKKMDLTSLYKLQSGTKRNLNRNFRKELKQISLGNKRKLQDLYNGLSLQKPKHGKTVKSRKKKPLKNNTNQHSSFQKFPKSRICQHPKTSDKSTAENTERDSAKKSQTLNDSTAYSNFKAKSNVQIMVTSRKHISKKYLSRRHLRQTGNKLKTSFDHHSFRTVAKPNLKTTRPGKQKKKNNKKKKKSGYGKRNKKATQSRQILKQSFKNFGSQIPSFLEWSAKQNSKQAKQGKTSKTQTLRNTHIKKRNLKRKRKQWPQNLISKELKQNFSNICKQQNLKSRNTKGRKVGYLGTHRNPFLNTSKKMEQWMAKTLNHSSKKEKQKKNLKLDAKSKEPPQNCSKIRTHSMVKNIRNLSLKQSNISVHNLYGNISSGFLEGASLKPKAMAESCHYQKISYHSTSRQADNFKISRHDSAVEAQSNSFGFLNSEKKKIYKTKNTGVVNFQYRSNRNLKPRQQLLVSSRDLEQTGYSDRIEAFHFRKGGFFSSLLQ